jgi:NAD(P)-dependent dehydrogenase (short-subunit alcohol dehydrogenase family)
MRSGAINQLSRSLACEWPLDNIRTNCVAPAVIRTPLSEDVSAFDLLAYILIICSLLVLFVFNCIFSSFF